MDLVPVILSAISVILLVITLIIVFSLRRGNAARDAVRDVLKTELRENRMEQGRYLSDSSKQISDSVDRFSRYLGDEMGKTRAEVLNSLLRIQQDNEKKLEQINQTVNTKLGDALEKRLGESFRLVSERLEQVYRGLGEMQQLANGVGDLKKLMSNVKTRGTWGEMQLESLLEQFLAPGQYQKNVQVDKASSERVEFAVVIPSDGEGDTVLLPIDSKFPIEEYGRLVEASESGDRQAVDDAVKRLDTAIRIQARKIRDKYISPPVTMDYAILFLPVEALFAEVMKNADLCEALFRDMRVYVCGPTTLAAMLNNIRMGFRTVAIEKRAGEVVKMMSDIRKEFKTFSAALEETHKRIRQADEAIGDATRRSQKIERKMDSFHLLPEEREETGLLAGVRE